MSKDAVYIGQHNEVTSEFNSNSLIVLIMSHPYKGTEAVTYMYIYMKGHFLSF